MYHKESPPHPNYVSTVPCESYKLQLLPISMACCIWNLSIHLAKYKATLTAQIRILWLWNMEKMQQFSKEDPWWQQTGVVD